MWYGIVTSTGSSTITVTYWNNNTGVNEITATEFTASGVNSSTKWIPISDSSTNSTTNTTTVSYPNFTTQSNSELYIGYGRSSGTGSAGGTPRF